MLKPVNYIELDEAIAKVSKEIEFEKIKSHLLEQIELTKTPGIEGKNIVLDVENGFIVKNTKNIAYCLADQSYSLIIDYKGDRITVSKPLKYLEEILPPEDFYRIHKSYLVNIHYIKQFIKADENHVILSTGEKIPVSVRKSFNFESIIKEMLKA